MTVIQILIILIAISFFYYGLSCLIDNRMKVEFHRFGIPQHRKLVGLSQLAASILMGLGYFFPILALIAASGLAIQMLLGFVLRISIRDGLLQSSPALIFMILNALLATELAKSIL
jgi:uncharacterized membrane protein YphA (DoxX/SURF4 family)